MKYVLIVLVLGLSVLPAHAQEVTPRLRDEHWRAADIYRVVDGDTVDATVDAGFKRRSDERLRLLGVNTPELRSRDPQERIAAQQAKDFTAAWLAEHAQMNTVTVTWGDEEVRPFNIQTEKDDSFGRWLATVECQRGYSLNQALLDSGNAVPFR